MTNEEFSWSRMMNWRSECHERFGALLDLPLSKPSDELAKILRSGKKVLDLGCGVHKPFKRLFDSYSCVYTTMDTDPLGDFDYNNFDQVPQDRLFDVILANQVLEHMPAEKAFEMTARCYAHLGESGYFVATVPNAAHPVRQRDCTHITAWPVNDLYCLLKSAGFEIVFMSRYNKLPLTSNFVKKWIVMTVCREFRVDWCDSILAVGHKRAVK